MVDLTREILAQPAAENGWSIGDHTYGGPLVHQWGSSARLIMGRYCSIGPNVNIFLGGDHRTDWITTYPFNVLYGEFGHITGHPHSRGDVVIGNDVWLASNATIFSGVTIGDGCCVAGHAVVTKNMPPYSIVAGNPARPVRQRFSEEHVEALLETKWWQFDVARLRPVIPFLLSNDIDGFLLEIRKLRNGNE